MKNSAIVTAPDYDPMTRYLSAWARAFCENATKRGHNIYELDGRKASKVRLHGMIKKLKPEILFINGHGAEDKIAGHDNEIILDVNDVNILKSMVIYAVACKSAQLLGPEAVKKGARGFVGYMNDFILVSQPNKVGHPLEDTTAALFLEPSNDVIVSLMKGHSPVVAAKKGRASFTESIKKALNSDIQSDDDKFIPYLHWNRMSLASF